MKAVFVASDHAGIRVKKLVIKVLNSLSVNVKDFSLVNEKGDDYPDYAKLVAENVVKSKTKGVLVCGTGIGMSIAANKIKGVRAALCKTPKDAALSRQHNDSNILVLGSYSSARNVEQIVRNFFLTTFNKGRHLRRVKKIKDLEKST